MSSDLFISTATVSLLLCSTAAWAAPATAPISLTDAALPLDAVAVLTVDGPDYDALWKDDLERDRLGQPWQFAVPNTVSATPFSHGTWSFTAEGRLLWQLRVVADQSLHLNLGFEAWTLPPSAHMWITASDGGHVRGPWTVADNAAHGELWTPIVFADDIVIEIEVDPAERLFVEASIELSKVNAGYRGFEPPGMRNDEPGPRGSSESCNVDVMCPEGDPWWDEIPSVGVYTLGGFLTCTGAMINNTAQDERPLFLTAEHCGINSGNDQSLVVYWNHQNSTCRTGGSSGNNGNGNFNQSTSGSTHLVNASATDCTLVELSNDPNPAWGVTFSGWNRSSSTPSEGSGIHHPQTAEKRISLVQDIWASSGWGYQFWRVNWGVGRTAPGSSGSPLFDANYRIVGQLYGGWSYCTNDDDDVYGRSLSYSWSSLSSHLDPTNSGAMTLNSLNPGGVGDDEGACCISTTCVIGPETTCDNVGGTYYGDGVACSEVDCDDTPPVTGACCIGTNCVIVTSDQCSNAGGTYQGDNSNCGSADCDGGGTDEIEIKSIIRGQNKVDGVSNDWTVDVYAVVPEDWRVDAVAGTAAQQKTISCSTSFYQDAYGGPMSTDVNPAFYDLAPSLRWDSRVTIGAIDSSGDPFDENVLQSIGINWATFESGGDLSVDDGTWFILPTDDQGESRTFVSGDCSEQYGVLVARLTPIGHNAAVTFEALIQGKDDNGTTWQAAASSYIEWSATEDCNDNGIPDSCDIALGNSTDADGNGVPDECDGDCPGDLNGDGIVDVEDVLTCIAGFGSEYTVDDLLEVLAEFGSNC